MTARTFEIRHFTADPAANGESDFIGPTMLAVGYHVVSVMAREEYHA